MTKDSVQPIFVLCHARSGSTLLRYVLDSHPEIWAPPEVHFAILVEHLHRLLTAHYQDRPDLKMNDADICEEVGDWVCKVAQKSLPNSKAVWCQKSVLTIDHLDLIERAFPNARYVCLYRHCKDFVRSAMELSKYGWHEYGFEGYLRQEITKERSRFVDALVRFWCDKVTIMRQFEGRSGDRVKNVKYENLLLRGKETADDLFGFFSLSPSGKENDQEFWGWVFESPQQGVNDAGIGKTIRPAESIGRPRDVPEERFAEIDKETQAGMEALLRELDYPMESCDILKRAGQGST